MDKGTPVQKKYLVKLILKSKTVFYENIDYPPIS